MNGDGEQWPEMDRGWREMAGDGRKRMRMAGDGWGRPEMAGDGREWPEMDRDGEKWPEMDGDGGKWLAMAGNGRGWPGVPVGLNARVLKRGALALRDFLNWNQNLESFVK